LIGFSVKYENMIVLPFACLELLGDLLKHKPKETDGIDSVVVVDCIPKVGPEKQDKLKNMIRKIFGKFGKIQTESFPLEGDTTKG
jgi:translation initiation factor 3 subunit B